MNNEYIECGYYFCNNEHYIIKVDRNLKKHYFNIKDKTKEVDFVIKEELDKIFNPDLFASLPKQKNDIFIPKGIPGKYQGCVLEFIKKMKMIFLIYGLDIRTEIEEKLADLTIIDYEQSSFESEQTKGKYDPLYNIVYINPKLSKDSKENEIIYTISHESFHAITTNMIHNKNELKVGFYSIKDNIGIGLTEYGTKYFIGRFIGGRKDTFDDFDIEIMKGILSILGYQLFLRYISQNDIKGLIQYLATYIDQDQAIRLMLLIDNYYYTVRSFKETRILKGIGKLLSDGSPINEIYELVDKKVQLNFCKDKYEEDIAKILDQIKNNKENTTNIEIGKSR
jgi:hypothetical protein